MRVLREARSFGGEISKFAKFFAGFLLCFVLLCAGAQAGQHPVPLGKSAGAAKCIQCHADKAEGKHVHSAIAMARKR